MDVICYSIFHFSNILNCHEFSYIYISICKKGILEYRVLKKLNTYSLLEVDLHTGRHHQIRSQLSAIGCPIKGDLKYGFDRSNPDGSIHLHSRKLTLVHPVQKKEMTFIADPPLDDNLWRACLDD